MTSVSVSTSKMVSSYNTNVGNTWRPAASNRKRRRIRHSLHVKIIKKWSKYHRKTIIFSLTNRGKEDDGEKISDWLDAPHDLGCDHGTLRWQQSSSQEAAQLHGNIQKLCELKYQTNQPLNFKLKMGQKKSHQISFNSTVSMKKTNAVIPSTRISLLPLLSEWSFL